MMMFNKSFGFILFVMFSVYISGCFASGESNIPVPFGGKWLMIEMQGKKDLPEGTFLYINSENAAYQISAGCNTFHGGYEQSGEKVTFATPAGTKKFCAELTDFETGYVRLITGADEMLIRKNVLQLYKNGELLLAFRKNEQ
jgi:heat shock protein HslJ